MIESGRFNPVIDRRYPRDQIGDAYSYVETGRTPGTAAAYGAGGGMVLGPGEVEIAELVASGFTDARIVARLRLSKRTFDARLE